MPTLFAFYSADDNSVRFYNRDTVPTNGSTYDGRTVTYLYDDFNMISVYPDASSVKSPFYSYRTEITSVVFVDVFPLSMNLNGLFRDFTALTSIDLTNLDISGATNMSYLFSGCTSLTTIDATGLNTAKIKKMDYAFSGCSSLRSILVSYLWTTESVTSSTNMFSQCVSLFGGNGTQYNSSYRDATYARIDTADTPGYLCYLTPYENLGYLALVSPPKKTRYDEGDVFDPVGASVIFVKDKDETSVMIPIDSLSYSASALTKGTESIRVSYTRDNAVFYLDIPISVVAPFAVYSGSDYSLTFYKDSFFPQSGATYNGKVATYVYTGIETQYTTVTNGVPSTPWRSEASKIQSVSFMDEIRPVCTSYWFHNFTTVTSIDLTNLNTERTTDMGYMFYGCEKLTILDVSSFVTSNVTNMRDMFHRMFEVDRLDVSNFDVRKVTDMSYMFAACADITSIDVSGWHTDSLENVTYMFYDTPLLRYVDISGWDVSKVENFSAMFYNAGIETIDLNGLDMRNAKNLSSMFSCCYNLKSIDLSGLDLRKVTSFSSMFWRSYNLSEVNLSRISTRSATSMSSMFSNINAVELDLSGFDMRNVTNITGMFSNDSGSELKTIYVSDGWDLSSVTKSDRVFSGCSGLIGGNGTSYSAENIDGTYARVDTADTTGYLTYKEHFFMEEKEYFIQGETLSEMASSVRAITNTQDDMSPDEMITALDGVTSTIDSMQSHIDNTATHVTAAEKASWNAKDAGGAADAVMNTLNNHTSNSSTHVTDAQKANWDAKQTEAQVLAAIRSYLNRSDDGTAVSSVGGANQNYTSYMARGEALFSESEAGTTYPTVNGTIMWIYS